MNTRVSKIKKSQKESLLRKERSELLQEASLDNPQLQGLSASRVELSADKGIAHIFFFLPEGEGFFEKKLEFLKLFKPSLKSLKLLPPSSERCRPLRCEATYTRFD